MNSFKPPITPPSRSPDDIHRAVTELCIRQRQDQLLPNSTTLEINETPNGKIAEVRPSNQGGTGDPALYWL